MNKKVFSFVIIAIIGILIWWVPPPSGVSTQAMHILAIFIFTILGMVLKPLPGGAMAFIALMLLGVTKTLTFEESFYGFKNHVVWLIVFSFFISRGFIKTGFGERIAYLIMRTFGRTSLGLGYGVVATDFIVSPAIPSITARAGGIVYPVYNALSNAFESYPHNKPRKLGAFLMQNAIQASAVTSAMFLTAMAGNPLAAEIASNHGINISWGTWALAASIPGLICLILIPPLLYKLYPPDIKVTENARVFADKNLKRLGKMKSSEWIMLFVFVLLITLWILGPMIQMKATITAMLGLCFLLVTRVLSWDDLISEKGAWNTLVWFAALVMLASNINKVGLTMWFSQFVGSGISGFNPILAFGIVVVIYYFSHYFFASNTAHIGAMFPPFLLISISLGISPLFAALLLAFSSNLTGALTPYASGPAAVIYSADYIKAKDWWRLGFIFSVLYLVVWLGIGSFWWKLTGIY